MKIIDTRPDIPIGFTLDQAGNMLTHKRSDGSWREYTYDQAGNMLTRKRSDGASWVAIAHADGYILGYDANTHLYHTSCRVFTREQALAHWGSPREDNMIRASIFLEAINNHKE